MTATPTAAPFVRYLEPRSADMPDVRITIAPDATVRLAQGGNVVTVHPDDLWQLRELLAAAEREAAGLVA